jgi:hypothetical protein
MILLLPDRRRFQAATPALATLLGRGDRLADGGQGERAQLLRHFSLAPAGWPMAAITRQLESGDGAGRAWLRADPAFVQVETAGARLHAVGSLQLTRDEADDFLAILRPVFGDAGMALDAPTPDRWYLALAPGAPLPEFADPELALGADLFSLLPAGPEGRRWRALFNEAQVLLHQHPRNAARIAAGRAPVNAVWPWGGGSLPNAVRSESTKLISKDIELLALAALAKIEPIDEPAPGALVDLRQLRDPRRLENLLVDALREGFAPVLDFADGARWALRAAHRWRFWRKPHSFTA